MLVAACQFDIAWEDKAANFARVRSLLQQQPPAPGTLLVLPEMFATGFSTQTAVTAQGDPPECDGFLRDLARQYGIWVLGGVVGRGADGKLGNDAVAFGPDGKEVARYTKIHPFTGGGEHTVHRAGSQVVTFRWGGFTVAPLICYDLRFPEPFRDGLRAGADLFVVMASWPVMRDRHWQVLLQARAIENQAYVVGVNRRGKDPFFYHSGRSAIVDPHGVVVADAGEREMVLMADLDPTLPATWRRDFPAVRDFLAG